MIKKSKKFLIISSTLLLIIVIALIFLGIKQVRTEKQLSGTNEKYQINDKIEGNKKIQVISNSSPIETTNIYTNDHYENVLTSSSYSIESLGENSNNNSNNSNEINLENRSIENVNVEVISNTITRNGATVIITDNNETSFSWNEEIYKIERKYNDVWKEVDNTREKGYDILLLGYVRDENNQYKFEIDWTKIYGTLSNGFYRIVEISTESEIAYSNEFEIK